MSWFDSRHCRAYTGVCSRSQSNENHPSNMILNKSITPVLQQSSIGNDLICLLYTVNLTGSGISNCIITILLLYCYKLVIVSVMTK